MRSHAAMFYNQAEGLFELGDAARAITLMEKGRVIAQNSGNQSLPKRFESYLCHKYTESRAGLNERQRQAIYFARHHGRITKKQYCAINAACSEATARRDIDELLVQEIFGRFGKGRGSYYKLMGLQ